MARFSSLARVIPASAATLIALGMLAAPTSASASAEFKLPQCFPNCGKGPTLDKDFIDKYSKNYGNGGGYKGGYGVNKFGNGWGYGAAALGGMAVGLVAAGAASAQAGSASASAGECYLVRRRAADEDGNEFILRVRVCE